MGIVKREDKTGEIWLYIPRKSKKITIKHPEWGVLRDYQFPTKIESHITYELKVEEPSAPIISSTPPTVSYVRDTIILTQIDTLLIKPAKTPVPLTTGILATLSYGGNSKTLSGGLLLTVMKRHGAFVHLSSDFGKFVKTKGVCDKEGIFDSRLPYYSGNKRHSFFLINAGAGHRINDRFKIFEGIGYGINTISWELAESEGGGYLKNNYYSIKGFSFEAGLLYLYKRMTFSFSISSIKGLQWYGSLGIGFNIGKK